MGEGGGWESGVWFTGKIELGVIHEAVKINTIFTEDIAEGEEVYDEEEGPQDGALGHT